MFSLCQCVCACQTSCYVLHHMYSYMYSTVTNTCTVQCSAAHPSAVQYTLREVNYLHLDRYAPSHVDTDTLTHVLIYPCIHVHHYHVLPHVAQLCSCTHAFENTFTRVHIVQSCKCYSNIFSYFKVLGSQFGRAETERDGPSP